jgi:hypothetical protein
MNELLYDLRSTAVSELVERLCFAKGLVRRFDEQPISFAAHALNQPRVMRIVA